MTGPVQNPMLEHRVSTVIAGNHPVRQVGGFNAAL